MSEAIGRVVASHGDEVWVETRVQSSCSQCGSQQGGAACGTATLAPLFGRKIPTLRLQNTISAQMGDEVVIHVADQGVVVGSLLLYLLPLLALMFAAGIGQWWAGEGGAIALAGVGFIFGLWGVRLLERQQLMRRVLHTTLRPMVQVGGIAVVSRGAQ